MIMYCLEQLIGNTFVMYQIYLNDRVRFDNGCSFKSFTAEYCQDDDAPIRIVSGKGLFIV